jgi:hypothetical protein
VPTGTVTFLVDGHSPTVRTLDGATAMIKAKPSWISKKAVTIVYGGDDDFHSSAATAVAMTGPHRLRWRISGTL